MRTAENRRGSLAAPLDSLNRKNPSARYIYPIPIAGIGHWVKNQFFFLYLYTYYYYMEKDLAGSLDRQPCGEKCRYLLDKLMMVTRTTQWKCSEQYAINYTQQHEL